MAIFNDIIEIMLNLTDEQLEKVKAYILTKLSIVPTETAVEITTCPICGSKHIIRYGKKNGKQRFYCKDCEKTFVPSTNSITYKSKRDFSFWSEYVTCMLSGLSCRQTGKIVHISHKTAFYWRHKIMGSLKE